MRDDVEDVVFPPIFIGLQVEGALDPFTKACAEASLGCEAGLISFHRSVNRLSAAMVFAPEVPLSKAMAMLPACEVGFQNALGALAPPEVAVHIGWPDGIYINGASCGAFKAEASTTDPAAAPDWLVIGFHLPLMPEAEDPDAGLAPDRTTLYAEGCADVLPTQLLESWSRHTLVWINRWMDEGNAPLHAEWRGILRDVGEETVLPGDPPKSGTFVGVDEDFGMLLRTGSDTTLIPLTETLTRGRP